MEVQSFVRVGLQWLIPQLEGHVGFTGGFKGEGQGRTANLCRDAQT